MSCVGVIHALRSDSRPTTIQNVTSLSKYLSATKILNVNAFGLVPTVIHLDVVILTYDFLALRTWPIWNILLKRVESVLRAAQIRIAMPQDDYTCCDVLDKFICDFGITHVYTPITRDLDVLYPKATTQSVTFGEALTGYVDEEELRRFSQFSRPFAQREVDLGQRVRRLSPHLGERAQIKWQLAEAFSDITEKAGFVCDVSTQSEDVLTGDSWYQFLGNTRFTVGSKGGASLADPKGKLADQVRRMRTRKPEIQDAEIWRRLKLQLGRSGDFAAISPRIFETSALGACQILMRDDYFDGFEPWVHYVPLDSESQVLNDVFGVMRDYERAGEIVRASQDFLINSGKYTYKRFFNQMIRNLSLETTSSSTEVLDSSSQLDGAIGSNGEALPWVQSYLARATASGSLRKVERFLSSGRFLYLNEDDKNWNMHVEANRNSLLLWVESLRSRKLIVESAAIPWRSVTSYLCV